MPERCGSRRRGRSAAALPDVRADVVVIAAGGEEGGLGSQRRHRCEPEHVAVEGIRLGYRGDLEVDVTDDGRRRDPIETVGGGIADLGDQVGGVQRHRRHPRRHLPLPRLAGAIPVDLEAVPVGVPEVERLADEVVGHAGQRNPITGGMGEPAGEVGALRQQQGDVVEAGVSGARPRARLFDGNDQLPIADPDRCRPVGSAEDLETDHAPVESQRPLEVGDGEVDRSESRRGGDLPARRRSGRLELLRVIDPDLVRIGHRCRRVCDARGPQVQRARRIRAGDVRFRSLIDARWIRH